MVPVLLLLLIGKEIIQLMYFNISQLDKKNIAAPAKRHFLVNLRFLPAVVHQLIDKFLLC